MSQTAKIGAFFLVVLVLLAVLIMKIEDIPFGTKARREYKIAFRDAAGLDKGSAVRIAGVRVGKIDRIDLQKDGTAIATLAIDSGVEVREGAKGAIRAMGLLGDKYVELSPGDPAGAPFPIDKAIAGATPTGFDDLTQLASDIGKDVKELSGALRGSLGGKAGEEKINRIVDNIGRLAESLRELVDANRKNVDVTLANMRQFSSEIRETLARVDRILEENRAGVKSSVSNIDEVSGKLKKTADNLSSITTKIDSGEGTIGKLVNDDETHTNLNDTLKSVKSGVDSLNSTLTKINKLELDLGFRGEYLARSADSKAYFTLDITPRPNKFYRLEVTALPKGRRKDTTETTTTTLPDGSKVTSVKEIETFQDEFALSLQVGYRKWDTILRAGLIESRGGVGIDQLFLKDRLQLSAEAWDFGRRNASGNLKVFGRWKVSPNIYGTAGVDEVLNSDVRSVFVGAGISWKDEDIKTLLGAVPFIK